MPGGIVQLVAYGIQDIYLTGDPQITFFKVLYRRHTNFAIESIIQNFSERANFGSSVTCTLARTGDLVNKMYLYVQLPCIPKYLDINGKISLYRKIAWVRYLGTAIIREITVEIGGKLIDRQYGEWLYLWYEVSNRQDDGYKKMVGDVPQMYDFTNGKNGYELYIPLNFWFCQSIGLSLPLIALASTDVKIKVTLKDLNECIRAGPTSSIELLEDIVPFNMGDYIEQTISGIPIKGYYMGYDYLSKKLYYIKIFDPNSSNQSFKSANVTTSSITTLSNVAADINKEYRIYNPISGLYATPKPNTTEITETINIPNIQIINAFLYVNYVYLDTDERMKFARSNHEYLIEQIQYNQIIQASSPNILQNLTLNHPCKSHYWICQLSSLTGAGTINDIYNYTTSSVRYEDGRLYGGNIVQKARLLLNGQYRAKERDNTYYGLVVPYQCHYRGPEKGINAYSFCINPEDSQPSGSCNMSKIDNVQMEMKLSNVITTQSTCKIRSYTINYNILRIMFNLGGLAFV
jgi:hypothetical protein